jgi:hypothetical protein
MTIELTARYYVQDENSVTLLLDGDLYQEQDADQQDDDSAGLLLTILHERFSGGVAEHDLEGAFKLQLQLTDCESLTFIVRQHGRIVGCLVNEVDTESASRVLLRPKGGFHLIIHQQRCEQPEDVQVMAALNQAILAQLHATPHEELQATPATARLDQLIKAVEAHYAATPHPLPETFRLLWPVLKEAVGDNDDHNSKEMLFYLCVTIEARCLQHALAIAPLYDRAQALIAAPLAR